jgi:hypothetical protein
VCFSDCCCCFSTLLPLLAKFCLRASLHLH